METRLRRVVVVRLCNGLGNQMFQYALGRHLALLNDAELKLDTTYFPYDPLRKYELHNLCIVESFAGDDEIALFKPKDQSPPPGYYRAVQKDRLFDHKILKLRGNMYLEGYWQTEKYFADIREVLLDDFEVRDPEANSTALLAKIEATNSVALHVRRSDYVTNPRTNFHHGVLPLEYYQQAMRYISHRVEAPVFYVFSDDPEWSKRNIKPPGETCYVEENDASRGCDDLWLMKGCRHFIIANSSFSWWGAWLAKNPQKLVVAPRRWFAESDIDTKDIVPAGWTRL